MVHHRVYILFWVLIPLVLTFGCMHPSGPSGMPLDRTWETGAGSPSPSETPRSWSGGGPVRDEREASPSPASSNQPVAVSQAEAVATVNGERILERDLLDTLLEAHGLRILEQQILTEAARQRAEELGLKVSKADVAAAHDDALRRLANPIGEPEEGETLDEEALEKAKLLLDEFLLAKNISPIEWDMRMKQRAYLREIAEAEVAEMEIGESLLQEEYQLAYGERVVVRHIQVASLGEATRVRDRLEAGEDFELIARQMSANQFTAAHGGLMPPITKNDSSVTPMFRRIAFELEVGKVSPAFQEGTWYHIIRVEKRYPPSDVPFEDADHESLRRRLRERLIRQRQEGLEAELFTRARIVIHDPLLREQFRSRFGDRR